MSKTTSMDNLLRKDSAFNLKEIPLSFPDISVPKKSKNHLYRFNAVLKRTNSVGVCSEDVEALQSELEWLLSSIVVRKKTLKSESLLLNDLEKYIGQSDRKQFLSNKRLTNISKKSKSIIGNKSESQNDKLIRSIKSEEGGSFSMVINEHRPEKSKHSSYPKSEGPNRFWNFVEPYCAPIVQEDIKLIKDLISNHDDLSEYYRIPPLGPHYSQKWASDDINAEKIKGNVSTQNESSEDESRRLLDLSRSEVSSGINDLTDRLIGGLIEANVMTSVHDSMDSINNNQDVLLQISKNKDQNSKPLEDRIRKELEKIGILKNLNHNEEEEEETSDEILMDLKRSQNELRALSDHNLRQLKKLLALAEEEMTKQELRKKMEDIDNEVMEAYKKINLARSKKRTLSKKEKDAAWKAIKERKNLMKELDFNKT